MSDSDRSAFHLTSFRRSVMFTGSGSSLNILFLLMEMVAAVRFLSTEAYGVYVLLIAVTNFLVMVSDFGFKTAVTQMIAGSAPEHRAAIAENALAFRLLVSTCIVAALWPAQNLLSLLSPPESAMRYAVYLPLLFTFASFDELLNGMLQGFHQYRHLAIVSVARGILRFILTLFFLGLLDLELTGLIYSWILSFAASCVFQLVVLPIPKRITLSRQMLGSIVRFGFPLQVTRYLWFAFYQTNVLLLGALAGPASVACYAVAARIPDAFERLFESYIAVFFPSMSALLASVKRAQADWVLNHSLRLISFVSSFAALVGVLFGHQAMVMVFSEKYADSGKVFGVLMVALQVGFLFTLMGYTLTAAGYPGRSLAVNLTRAVINVVGDLALIPLLGVMGPAIASLVASHGSNPIALLLLKRSGMAAEVGPYVKQSAVLLIYAAVAWSAEALQWVDQSVQPVFGAAVLTLFVGTSFLTGAISREDLSLLLPRITKNGSSLPKESVQYGQR